MSAWIPGSDATPPGVGRLQPTRLLRLMAPWIPFLAVLVLFVGGSLVLGPALGWQGLVLNRAVAVFSSLFAVVLAIVCAVVLWVGNTVSVLREGIGLPRAIVRGWQCSRRPMLRTTVRIAVLVGSAVLVTSTFTSWRVSIPHVHPFAWDATLRQWDRALGGGKSPWRMAHALLSHPAVGSWLAPLVDWSYSQGWYIANIGVVLALAAAPVRERGQRVLIAYALQFALLGSLLATLMSSAGPVYYARVVPVATDPYAPLLRALATQFRSDVALHALAYQQYLWKQYLAGNAGLTTGITAFPSMHVSTTVLLALALNSWRRWAGIVGWIVVALTLFGSVTLGWHYAVDGYASIVGMLALWWVAGRLARWRPRLARVQAEGSRFAANRAEAAVQPEE